MRKILSLVLALSMVLGMFSFAFAAELSDIDGEYYEAAVEALVELGVVNGYGDGTFKPNNEVSRAEMAKMLVIALGQKQAAEIAKGSTQFSDVEADHWAAGYINVAAQYKVIVGYPDGTFDPEAKVTYAEAVTMALRALGYKNVVESAGTWPTNYITKANELQLLDNMKYNGADDGAKRGNVAILLWNMLRKEMWAIREENQTNGMTYSETLEPMLNIKFPGFAYDDELELDEIVIADDGKVTIKFFGDATEYELTGGDLLRMVSGMKVAALVNLDDEKVLSLTCVDTMIEGRRDEDGKVAGRKYAALDTDGVYYVAVVDGKNLKAGTVASELPQDSEELTAKKIKSLVKNDEDAEKIYLIDGEWATVNDLKEGDVITEVADLGAVNGTFWAVSRETVEGDFDAFVTDDDGDHIEVDGKEYEVLAGTKFYEYSSSKDKDVEIAKADLTKKDNKYIDEEAKLVLNYLGDVVAIYFDEIKEKATSNVGWYVQTGNQWTETGKSGIRAFVTLTDTNGDEDDYEFDYSNVTSESSWAEQLTNVLSALLYDDDGDGEKETLDAADVLDLVIPAFTKDGMLVDAVLSGDYYMTDADDAIGEYVAYDLADAAGVFDADTKYFTGAASDVKVSSATKVITITPVIDDEKVVELKIEVTEGSEAVEGVTAAKVVVKTIVEDDIVTGVEARAAYVFVAEDASSAELTFDRVAKEQYTKNGRKYIGLEDNKAQELAADSAAEEGSVVAYTTKDDKISVRFELMTTDVDDGNGVVTKVDNEIVYVDGAKWLDTDVQADKDAYRNTRFVLVEASVEEDDAHNDVVVFDDVEELGKGLDKAEFEEYDRLFFATINGEDFVFIVRASEFGEDTQVNAGIVTD